MPGHDNATLRAMPSSARNYGVSDDLARAEERIPRGPLSPPPGDAEQTPVRTATMLSASRRIDFEYLAQEAGAAAQLGPTVWPRPP
jgi:hypothetical protein